MAAAAGAAAGRKAAGYNQVDIPQFTPEQWDLFQRTFSQVSPGSYTSRLAGGDPALFEEMERPARRQFGEMLGQIGSRFSGAGMGGRKSSGFNLATTSAAQDFAQNLQAQRQALQRQAIGDLMGYSNQLLSQRPYETVFMPQKKPFWQEFLTGMAPGVGSGIGTFGGMGAAKAFGLF